MMKTPLDLLHDARPYLGHALMGMGAGCLISTVCISILAATFNPTGDTFMAMVWWVLGLFVVAVAVGAVGIILFMSPYDREQWHARHALRPAKGR